MSAIVSTKPPRRFHLVRKLAIAGVLAAGMFLSSELWYADVHAQTDRLLVDVSTLKLDLAKPDALIESDNLRQLPADLLDAPLLKDVLTEDFVFYYEQYPNRLGIQGALRRIAYEHELTFTDSLMAELLSQPAQVALYRGAGGKLEHVLVSIKRGALASMLQPLARVIEKGDSQLKQIGMLHVEDVSVPVYQLSIGAENRSILFAAYHDRMLVLNSAGMLTGNSDKLAQSAIHVLEPLLAGTASFADRFALPKKSGKHRVTVAADYLAMGYGELFPAFQAMSIQGANRRWSSAIAVQASPAEFDFQPLWQAMPTGASACAALPVSSAALAPILARLHEKKLLDSELSAVLAGPVALCWYASSRLHTPLIVVKLPAAKAGSLDAVLSSSFSASIGAYEKAAADGQFPVQHTTSGTAQLWQRNVGSSFGIYPAAQLNEVAELGYPNFFTVSLARQDDWLLFSLDDRLVARAQQTLLRRFPAIQDGFPRKAIVPIYLAPKSLASLLEQEALISLPQDREEILRNAVQQRLLPKLAMLAEKRAIALHFDAPKTSTLQWLALEVDTQ